MRRNNASGISSRRAAARRSREIEQNGLICCSTNSERKRMPQQPHSIVLIHGLWMTALSWEKWVQRYSEKGYRIVAKSWPGMDIDIDELRRKSRADRNAGHQRDHRLLREPHRRARFRADHHWPFIRRSDDADSCRSRPRRCWGCNRSGAGEGNFLPTVLNAKSVASGAQQSGQ